MNAADVPAAAEEPKLGPLGGLLTRLFKSAESIKADAHAARARAEADAIEAEGLNDRLISAQNQIEVARKNFEAARATRDRLKSVATIRNRDGIIETWNSAEYHFGGNTAALARALEGGASAAASALKDWPMIDAFHQEQIKRVEGDLAQVVEAQEALAKRMEGQRA